MRSTFTQKSFVVMRSIVKKPVPKPVPRHPMHGRARKIQKLMRKKKRKEKNLGQRPRLVQFEVYDRIRYRVPIPDIPNMPDYMFSRQQQVFEKIDWKTEGF